jgi:NAD(P)-dependent dehydrogenase (short-subunit alcohol dehydrogenase family)
MKEEQVRFPGPDRPIAIANNRARIGRATALAFAEIGAHVLVHYGRFARGAQRL